MPKLLARIQALGFPDEVKAGLFLNAGNWEKAHLLVQPLSSQNACYWHALVHRTEGDHSNAHYWLQRTGKHPVHAQLSAYAKAHAQYAPALSHGHWDAMAFAQAFAKAAAHDWPYALARYEERVLLDSML